jgi:hypothetical protein
MGLVRLRRRYNPETGEMEDVPLTAKQSVKAHFVWNDLPGYISPVTGLHVEGRRQRRNDLAATGCRPYEGREQELQEARKVERENEAKLDQLAEKMAHEAWRDAPERIRKQFRYK